MPLYLRILAFFFCGVLGYFRLFAARMDLLTYARPYAAWSHVQLGVLLGVAVTLSVGWRLLQRLQTGLILADRQIQLYHAAAPIVIGNFKTDVMDVTQVVWFLFWFTAGIEVVAYRLCNY